VGLHYLYDHHALNLELIANHAKQGLGMGMKRFITGIHILRMAHQLPTLLHKDVNQADAHLGVLLDVSDADGRRNVRDDQMPFIDNSKDLFG
jgi:hypothetical protein